jgi:hypothetical protein
VPSVGTLKILEANQEVIIDAAFLCGNGRNDAALDRVPASFTTGQRCTFSRAKRRYRMSGGSVWLGCRTNNPHFNFPFHDARAVGSAPAALNPLVTFGSSITTTSHHLVPRSSLSSFEKAIEWREKAPSLSSPFQFERFIDAEWLFPGPSLAYQHRWRPPWRVEIITPCSIQHSQAFHETHLSCQNVVIRMYP